MIISVHPQNPQMRNIQRAVDILRAGGVVVYPTDTAYGVGCDVRSSKSIERISRITGHDKKSTFTFICDSFGQVDQYAKVSDTAFRLMKQVLPGPYTFILPVTSLVPKRISKERKTIGIRIPDNPTCIALVEELGAPLASASLRLEDAWTGDAYSIEDEIGHAVDAIIDGGVVEPMQSTIIDLTGHEPVILRQGTGDTSFLRL